MCVFQSSNLLIWYVLICGDSGWTNNSGNRGSERYGVLEIRQNKAGYPINSRLYTKLSRKLRLVQARGCISVKFPNYDVLIWNLTMTHASNKVRSRYRNAKRHLSPSEFKCYNLLKSPFPANRLPWFLFVGRFSPSSSSNLFTPIPNNNNFGAEGIVFCTCDAVRGPDEELPELLTRLALVSGGFVGMTRGFGFRAWTSVNNRAWEQYPR